MWDLAASTMRRILFAENLTIASIDADQPAGMAYGSDLLSVSS